MTDNKNAQVLKVAEGVYLRASCYADFLSYK